LEQEHHKVGTRMSQGREAKTSPPPQAHRVCAYAACCTGVGTARMLVHTERITNMCSSGYSLQEQCTRCDMKIDVTLSLLQDARIQTS